MSLSSIKQSLKAMCSNVSKNVTFQDIPYMDWPSKVKEDKLLLEQLVCQLTLDSPGTRISNISKIAPNSSDFQVDIVL